MMTMIMNWLRKKSKGFDTLERELKREEAAQMERTRKVLICEQEAFRMKTMAEPISIPHMVGLQELRMQLRRWANDMSLRDNRSRSRSRSRSRCSCHKALDVKVPNMAFIGNKGTGKSTAGEAMGKVLSRLRMTKTQQVVYLRGAYIAAEYKGKIEPGTRKRMKEAFGGVLIIDDAGCLAGHEALAEVLSFMDKYRGKVVVVFAGRTDSMKELIKAQDFHTRVAQIYFDDLTPLELAEMLHLKMQRPPGWCYSWYYYMDGYKLHKSCTVEAVAKLISRSTTKELRNKHNGCLVDKMILGAKSYLCKDLKIKCDDTSHVVTISMKALEKGLEQFCRDSV